MCKYVVVDLEMCKVPKGMRGVRYRWGCETIQIGAVLLNEEFQIVDQFNSYVHPQFGDIDARIEKLTGICKLDVKDAPYMRTALEKFVAWIPEDAVVVSWSENDEKQIRHEVDAKSIEIARLNGILERWIDCQKIFSEKMNTERCYRLSEALIAADISFDERAHDGYVDAYNTALLFAKMSKEPKLTLNRYYQDAREEEEYHLKMSLGDLLSGFRIQSCA